MERDTSNPKHQAPTTLSNRIASHTHTYYTTHNPRNNHESTGITRTQDAIRRNPANRIGGKQIDHATARTDRPNPPTHTHNTQKKRAKTTRILEPPAAQIRTHTNRTGTARRRRRRRRREPRAHLGGRMMKLTSWSIWVQRERRISAKRERGGDGDWVHEASKQLLLSLSLLSL